jgi:hypothetical protein
MPANIAAWRLIYLFYIGNRSGTILSTSEKPWQQIFMDIFVKPDAIEQATSTYIREIRDKNPLTGSL